MSSQNVPTFMIGNIPIFGDLILAPMDGFTDHPYRKIAREMGSPLVYTEFVNAMDVLSRYGYIEKKIFFSEMERPIGFQIFDNDPDRLLRAALILRERNPDFIDINMGCSEKAVSNRGAGAGLLKEPQKIATIFKQLSKNLDIPITGKIRLGWDTNQKNYLEVAKIIEDNGGKMIAVHARTRKQYFDGKVEWEAIAEIKHHLTIPILGNGDIQNNREAQEMRNLTGCDAVLVGRAAIGNPWIFKKNHDEVVAKKEVKSVIFTHMKAMVDYYGETGGLVRFRKHLTKYFKTLNDTDLNVRNELLKCISFDDATRILELWAK